MTYIQEKLDAYNVMYVLIYAHTNPFLQRSKLFFQSGTFTDCCIILLLQLLVLLSQVFNNIILQEVGGLMYVGHRYMNACTHKPCVQKTKDLVLLPHRTIFSAVT